MPTMSESRLPKVAIVGRPNVGKSSLLNLLANRRISIVDPTAGVTRDRVSTVIELPSDGQRQYHVELIDTGGYGIQDSQNLTADVERQIAAALGEAQLVLFVVDVQTGLLPLDEQVAHLLRTAGRKAPKVLLVVNKCDDPMHEAGAYDVASLGFGDPIPVSATTGHQRTVLLELIRDHIDFDAFEHAAAAPDTGVLLALVGKRNAGKSTLVNALAGEPRVIVSELEGTTRDSVDVRFELEGKTFTAIDTAGLRKRKSIKDDIEFYSMHRSLRSIRRADVVLLLIDSAVPLSQVDRQLGNEVLRHFKPTVVVINKWDLAEKKHTEEQYIEYLDKALKGLDFAPVVFITAKESSGLKPLMAMALNLHQQASHRVPTAELNRVMQQIVTDRPPAAKAGRHPKVYYATQLGVQPPSIGLFVNDPDLFDPGYQRYLLNKMREYLPFSEVPIRLIIRGRRQKESAPLPPQSEIERELAAALPQGDDLAAEDALSDEEIIRLAKSQYPQDEQEDEG
jgi:GTP-binding protein